MKYDMSGTSYSQRMTEKELQYEGLILKAETTNKDNDGKPTKKEAEYYQEAAKTCVEIRNMNLSQRDIVIKWNRREAECVAEIERIVAALKPVAAAAPAETAARTIAQSNTNNSGSSERADVPAGVTITHACKDVTEGTIASWFKNSPSHDFGDVTGMEAIKEQLEKKLTTSDWANVNSILGESPVVNLFFYGPPGSGKTYIIEAFIAELMKKGYHYIHLLGGDIHASLVGVAEKTIQIAVAEAISNEPCVIFIDEIENVCVDRGHAESHEKRLTVAFLEAYNMMLESGKNLVFLGATNHPEAVDSAMLDRVELVRVPYPEIEARTKFLQKKLANVQFDSDISLEDVASSTDGFSYRDLTRIVSSIVSTIKRLAISNNTVFDEEGNIDVAKTDEAAAKAIVDGDVKISADNYAEIICNFHPSNKAEILASLDAFEKQVAEL